MENNKKTAMQELSERVDKIIEYYSETHGVPSTYHFKLLKSLIDVEYMAKEKQQLIDAVNDNDKKCCDAANIVVRRLRPNISNLFEHEIETGEKHYNNTFNQ